MTASTNKVDISIGRVPNNLEAIPQLLEELAGDAAALATGGDDARQRLLNTSRSIVQALETPHETILQQCFAQVAHQLQQLQFNFDRC